MLLLELLAIYLFVFFVIASFSKSTFSPRGVFFFTNIAFIAILVMSSCIYDEEHEKKNPSTKESYESRLAELKRMAEHTGDYTEYAKLAPTDYYSECMYEIMELNRIHRQVAQYKRDHNMEYWEAYKYVMMELTPQRYKNKYVKYLSRQKLNQPELYEKEMRIQNEQLRPKDMPVYKEPEDVQYYMNWMAYAGFRTRQWLFKKGFVPHDFEKRVTFNGGNKPPIYVDKVLEPNEDKRYDDKLPWTFEMVCTPHTDDWYDDPTRMIIYPTGKDVADMVRNSKIRHNRMIIKRTKEFEKRCLDYKNVNKDEEDEEDYE